MAQSAALSSSGRRSFPFSRLLRYLRLIIRPGTGVDAASPATSLPDPPDSFPAEIDQPLPLDSDALCEHLVKLVHYLRQLLPGTCGWLEQGALEVAGEYSIDGGGIADIWIGMMGDRKVAIKSYRCYLSSEYLVTYMRFYKEALAYSRLVHQSIVPFIGVYSTTKHPLGLVFEYMEHKNLGEYLRNNRDVRRCELLLEIARGVEYMHGLNIVHGNLKITNILVDAHGRARIAGLGVALLLSTIPGADIDRFLHDAVPELVDPRRFGLTDTGTTKDSDVCAFSVLMWEVFAGRPPFADESAVGGGYSTLSGRRPPRPDHPELSDRLWEIIKRCWESVPSRGRTITEVVVVLDAELNRQ